MRKIKVGFLAGLMSLALTGIASAFLELGCETPGKGLGRCPLSSISDCSNDCIKRNTPKDPKKKIDDSCIASCGKACQELYDFCLKAGTQTGQQKPKPVTNVESN